MTQNVTLTIDFSRYRCDDYQLYVSTVREVINYRIIQNQLQKKELIKEIICKLPIAFVGNIENEKDVERLQMSTIARVLNLLLFVNADELNSVKVNRKKIRIKGKLINSYSFTVTKDVK